jgi:carboxymethylenebutenolidase
MTEREIRVDPPDGGMSVFIAYPEDGGQYPVAVVYQDGIGYREQLKANARRFAAAGYFVAAPDLFHRSGEKISFDMARLGDPDYRARLFEVMGAATPDLVRADTEALLAAIADDPAAAGGPKVCAGYCMGARLALHVASTLPDEFVAAAGIHPGALVTDQADSPHTEVASVRGELYFAFAEIDDAAPIEVVDGLRAELDKHGVKGVVERLPGVQHGFAMADLPVYDRDAAERHFDKTLELWRRSLSAEPVRA